ncbi:MAG TPA: carbamoyltransferase N-terminal domain-containing protein [Anaerolineales bacterium]|nr:carbamoyltransferase N-terminal domain-containing protein [Anaerolineales bacterium]
MYILGVSCYYHDSAAALLKDGLLVAAAEEERFSRIKHDYAFPKRAIAFCLEKAGITSKDLDYVVFYEKPMQKFVRILQTALQTFPQSYPVFRESMIAWFNDKLWIKGQLLTHLDIPDEKLLFVEHHLSHAASAFFCSPYDEAAVLTIDGVGEWTTATIGRATADWGNGGTNAIELFGETRFPHSLGLLYSAFTAFLGFRVNNGEYKVMGMAPYGSPTRVEDVYKLIEVDSKGGFRLNMEYFDFHHSTKRTISRRFTDLFGPARVPESEFFSPTTHPRRDHPQWDDSAAAVNQEYANIAASIQTVTEEIVLKMANYAQSKTGLSKLVMAGGVALNSVANGRIQRESAFDEVYIQPAAGDNGGALGAALYVHHVILGHPRAFVMEHAYWGQDYTPVEIRAAVEGSGFRYEMAPDIDRRAEMMVADMLESKVISLFQGRFEWGPRALGNRSILADPRSSAMKEVVNARIKFREPFRPFAPVIPEEEAHKFYAGIEDAAAIYPLRYMLMVYPTRDGQGEKIQAVTHEGGTGRLQTVRKEWNPLYHRAVELFGQATGVPVLLNTSFNLRGEPIVTTPQNALNTFSKSDMETLYIEDFVIRKQ